MFGHFGNSLLEVRKCCANTWILHFPTLSHTWEEMMLKVAPVSMRQSKPKPLILAFTNKPDPFGLEPFTLWDFCASELLGFPVVSFLGQSGFK